MITDNDIKKLKGVFATKDDLKGFATKDDLKGFATKDDLKGFATKDDLKGFATKDDLKGFATKDDHNRLEQRFDKLVFEFEGIKQQISNLATREELQSFRDGVYDRMDAVIGELKENREEQAIITQHEADNHQEIDSVKKRLGKIEAIPVIAHEIKVK